MFPNDDATTGRRLTAVIVGGGIAGLSAAWHLEKSAREDGITVSATLVEREDRLGGKIRAIEEDGFIVEAGPDGFLIRKPWAFQLANEAGLSEDVVYPQASGASLLHNGELHPIPRGLMGPAPSSLGAIWSASFLSVGGKIRASAEPLIRRRKADGRESIGHFLKRRLGAELTDTLLESLTAGIYGGDAYDTSLDVLFPTLPTWEKKYGSLSRGMREAKKLAKRSHPHPNLPPSRGKGSKSSQPPSPFFSLRNGASGLVRGVADGLRRTEIITGASATDVRRMDGQSPTYRITLDDGVELESDVLILANPAWDAARLVAAFAPGVARRLETMRSSPAGSVYLAFREDALSRPLEGTGFLTPRGNAGLVSGCTLMSSKWGGRSPDGYVLLRAFIGGPGDDSFLYRDEDDLTRAAVEELRPILGIRGSPERSWVIRWRDGMPRYGVDHADWLQSLDRELAPFPDLFLCGSSYRGIGVPDCVRQGMDAAKGVMQHLQRESTYLTAGISPPS